MKTKSPHFNHFLLAEEIITDSHIIRRAYYQEIHDKIKNSPRKKIEQSEYIEPMEVDTSSETIDTNDSLNHQLQLHLKSKGAFSGNFKVDHTPDIPIFGKFLIVCTITLFTIILYCFHPGNYYTTLDPEKQYNYVTRHLKEKIFGQNEVVEIITHSLKDVMHMKSPMMLVLLGTTGVGKTYVANIIKRFYLTEHIQEVSLHNLEDTAAHKSIIAKLDPDYYNLIIIDNLRAVHLYSLTKFVLKLPADHRLLIIPIFNVHDTINGVEYTINKEDYNLIRTKIDKLSMDYELVIFQQLKEDIVKNWLSDRLSEKGIHFSKHRHLINDILKNGHVKKKGFKELHTKLSLL